MTNLNPMLHSVNQGFAQEEAWYRCLEDEIAKADRGASAMFRRDDNVVWLSKKTGLKTPTYKLLSNGSAAEVIEADGCASDFIIEFFGSRTKVPICITALPNIRDEGTPHTIYTRDTSEIEALVKNYDKHGWAIYFGVAPVIEGKKRSKENAAEIVVLHADLDHKGIVEKHDAILEALQQLPMPPSLIVFSGHGLHCYWFLKKPMPVGETARVEACLIQIARVLAGDPAVCEIARIMRLPGTHNTKNGEWLDVRVIGERGPDYSFDDLEGWFSAADPVLTRVAPIEKEQKATSGNGHDPDAPDYDPWERYGIDYKEPIDPDVELGLMQYHDSAGHGIDRTQLRVIGHYTSQGYNLDEVIGYIVAKTFEAVPESALWHGGNRAAAEREEVSKLRDMCVRTYKKFPQHVGKQTNWPEWATDDRRLKKLLNGASSGVEPTENVVQFPANGILPPKKPEKVLPKLEYITLKDLRHELLKHVSWIVDKFILAGTVNGLFGDGATGKDQLLFQLAIALVSGAKWLGIEVPTTWNGEPIRVLWFPVEDPKEELRRRQHNIETYYAERAARHDEVFELQEDNLRIIPQIGKETVIAIYDHQAGVVKSTSLYTQMCVEIAEFKPHLVVVGNRVNIFSVNQNDDAQARQCINLLNHICEKYGTTVIMPAHPSQTGKNTGSGESGSVQWSNAVRQRLYLSKIKGEKGEPEPDPYARQLEVMKSNWAGSGEIINMQWTKVIDDFGQWYGGGVFVEDQVVMVKDENGEAKTDTQIKLEENTKIDADFMEMFDKATKMGITLSHKTRAENNAPTKFAEFPECRYRNKKGKLQMREAMMRLLTGGVLEIKTEGPPSKMREKLVRAGLRLVVDNDPSDDGNN